MTTFRRGAAALAAGFLVLGGAGAAVAQPADNPNEGPYWELALMDPEGEFADLGLTNVKCTKVADDYTEATWTADKYYAAVILNAGSEQSTPEGPDDVWFDVWAGDVLDHYTGKDISHVIACTADWPEEPTEEPEQPTEEPEEPTEEPEQPTEEPEQPTDKPEQPTDKPEHPVKPGTPGGGGDDAGKPIGPIVQTDVPAQGVNAALPLAALTAAGLGLAAVGLRRRGQEG